MHKHENTTDRIHRAPAFPQPSFTKTVTSVTRLPGKYFSNLFNHLPKGKQVFLKQLFKEQVGCLSLQKQNGGSLKYSVTNGALSLNPKRKC